MDRVEIPAEITGATAPGAESQQETAPSTQQAEATTDRPEWLPEGFDSPEALAEAYKSLTATKEAEVAETPEQTEANNKLAKFSDEFFSTGQLSAESYTELAKLGYPKAVVDQFISGQKAVLATEEAKVFSEVGGKEAYSQMLDWAGKNLAEAEIEAYNDAVQSGDMNQVMFAVRGLQARYATNTRGEPRLMSGTSKAAPTGFRSVAEMVSAMSDPRYKADPAYRADVERKIANSNSI